MALQNIIKTQYGINAEYWMLAPLQIDKFSKTAYMKLYGFINKEVRDAPFSKYVDFREYSVYPDEFDNIFNYTDGKKEREQAYEYIKLIDEDFKNAEKV